MFRRSQATRILKNKNILNVDTIIGFKDLKVRTAARKYTNLLNRLVINYMVIIYKAYIPLHSKIKHIFTYSSN